MRCGHTLKQLSLSVGEHCASWECLGGAVGSCLSVVEHKVPLMVMTTLAFISHNFCTFNFSLSIRALKNTFMVPEHETLVVFFNLIRSVE